MTSTVGTFFSEYWHVGLVALVLIGLTADFVIRFFLQSFRLKRELDDAINELRTISSQVSGELVDLSAVKNQAMKSQALNHLWAEYAKETLHKSAKAELMR